MSDRPSSDDAGKAGRSHSDRPSFRRRLLTTVGPALVIALGAIALVAWSATYVIYHRNAVETLETEVNEMRADARVAGDSLLVDDYAWDEAHHRLAIDRVDPIFVQVFDRGGRLIRSSANIDSLSANFPAELLRSDEGSRLVPRLETFQVGEHTLYYMARPLEGAAGEMLGHVQVARVLPEHQSLLWQFGLGLAGLWLVLSLGLMGLVAWAADRVLRPLRAITDVAESVSSADLDTRVDVPAESDRETAVLARTLNALLDRIKEHVETLRAFTANSAHELQTPLTVLRGHVEIALRRDRSAESYRKTLRLLDSKLGEMVKSVRALLTLARLDRDDRLDREPVDLAQIAQQETGSFRDPAREKGLRLSIDANEAVWAVGQPDLLRKVVYNLVDNAVKYTREGTIEVRVEQDDNRARLICSDTGIGMDEEERAHITSRFFRGNGADETGTAGSGLGLSLVQRIVEKHNGQLDVTSTPGEGTHVTVTLPASPPASEASSPDGERRHVNVSTSDPVDSTAA